VDIAVLQIVRNYTVTWHPIPNDWNLQANIGWEIWGSHGHVAQDSESSGIRFCVVTLVALKLECLTLQAVTAVLHIVRNYTLTRHPIPKTGICKRTLVVVSIPNGKCIQLPSTQPKANTQSQQKCTYLCTGYVWRYVIYEIIS